MKLGPLLLLASVAWLTTSVAGFFSSRETRPQHRPAFLSATGDVLTAHARDHGGNVNSTALAAQSEAGAAAKSYEVPEKEKETAHKHKVVHEEADHHARTAAELTGVKANEHGHSSTTLITGLLNMSIVVVCMLAFSALRLRYPVMYSGNVVFSKIAPLIPQETFVGWLSASFSVSIDIAAESLGLDAALLIEFCNIACKILAIIGIPLVCIMCPLHFAFGGHRASIHDMSSVAMGNVVLGHPWLYHVHAVIVNLVTLVVIQVVYASMPEFLRLRYKWLKNMSAPRCFTVLVEGIPPGWRSDSRLKEYFSTVFKPEYITDCVMVKSAPHLLKVFNEESDCKELLKDYKDKWQAAKYVREDRPMMQEQMCIGKQIDAIEYLEKKLAELKPRVEMARATALTDAETEGEINCSSGFVTFTNRREAETCLNVTSFSSKRDEWVVSAPPPASDVRWNDLKQPETRKKVLVVIGYGCTVMVFVIFLPIVVVGTSLSRAVHIGFMQPIWESFAPSIALMLFLAFLPTVLLLIFSSFFNLKSEIFAQHKLQTWYFLFMVFYVLLVTVVGQSLIDTFAQVVQRPVLAIELLAENMPKATQFYMDFLMLQWGEQSLNFLRWVPVGKFLFFSSFYEEEDAKRMSEPEDQDFYGIGSRSARFTISLLIGIVFSTLSPLVAMVALILFGLMRVYYGYLVVFAEVKKPDLGGVFFHQQLQHLILGVGVYSALMIGVLCFRASTNTPMLIAMPSLLYTVWSYWHFSNNFVWKGLPFSEVCNHPEEFTAEDNHLRYIQPEFADPNRGWIKRSLEWLNEARRRAESGGSSQKG